jgi:hypothetical protein
MRNSNAKNGSAKEENEVKTKRYILWRGKGGDLTGC